MTVLYDLAAPTVALLVGVGIGRWLERTRRPEPVRPICACRHSRGEHADAGNCLAEVERDRRNRHGDWIGHDYAPCPCRRYTGPEPLPEYWAPPPLV